MKKTKMDKDLNVEVKTNENEMDVEAEKREKEIKKNVANFEREYRRDFEKNIHLQVKTFESLERGEIPTPNVKNRQIVFTVIDTSWGIPLYLYFFDVDVGFNAIAFAQVINESMNDYLKSKQFLEAQKRMYYRLKMQGVKDTEIYYQIEPRYFQMDGNEKKKFRNGLARWYGRKMKQKKGDKTSEMSPHSDP